jgi:hypothetical protein
MVDDYELSADGRELLWFDPTDRLPDPAERKLEPEVETAALTRAIEQRDAAATLRATLARTGMPRVKAPIRRRPAAAPR